MEKESGFFIKEIGSLNLFCKLFHKRSLRCSAHYKSVTAHLILYHSRVSFFVIIRIQMNPGSQKMN